MHTHAETPRARRNEGGAPATHSREQQQEEVGVTRPTAPGGSRAEATRQRALRTTATWLLRLPGGVAVCPHAVILSFCHIVYVCEPEFGVDG